VPKLARSDEQGENKMGKLIDFILKCIISKLADIKIEANNKEK